MPHFIYHLTYIAAVPIEKVLIQYRKGDEVFVPIYIIHGVINNYTFAIAQKMGLGFKGFFNLFGICCTLVYIRYSKKYIPKNTIIIYINLILCILFCV